MEGFACQLRAGEPLFLANANIAHPVHPVGGDTVALGKTQQIVVFVVLA
jgi:hypothetical protein